MNVPRRGEQERKGIWARGAQLGVCAIRESAHARQSKQWCACCGGVRVRECVRARACVRACVRERVCVRRASAASVRGSCARVKKEMARGGARDLMH
eukprot:2425415-Pleurochrysis_carterae.AAC.4